MPDDIRQPVDAQPTVGILACVREELKATAGRLNLRRVDHGYSGYVGRLRVMACVSGVGGAAAIEAADRLMRRHHLISLIHIGFAGGLDGSFRPGDVPALRWVMDERGLPVRINEGVPQITSDLGSQRRPRETLLTLDRVADSTSVKRWLLERYHAGLVDMETYHIAQAAAKRKTKLVVYRAVTDPADVVLPAASTNWVRPDGSSNVLAVSRYLMARPWQIGRLLRLGKYAQLAGEHLAESVARAVSQASAEWAGKKG